MNDSIDGQSAAPQFLTQESPGTRLRLAREAAGLTRAEIALHMHINERKVQALEEDNYDIFPSETFVSGFLRSYAKVLGLPESDFVRPVSSTSLPPSLAPSIGTGKQASSMDLPVQMVTYVIAALVVVSLVGWWLTQREKVAEDSVAQQQEESVEQTESAVSAAVAPQATDETEMAGEGESETPAESEESPPAVVETEEGGVQQPEATTPVAQPKQEQPPKQQKQQVAETPEPQDPAAPPMVVANTETTANQPVASSTEVDAASPPPLATDAPRSKLVLEYREDSWSEVDDEAGRRLVYGLMRAGQTIELKGQAPFRIFLGYAEGVTIHYNDELFDHSAFQRGEIARFRVGRAEDNKPDLR